MKMKTFLVGAAMLSLTYFIAKQLYKDEKRAECTIFVLLMLYTTYEGIAELRGLPRLLLIEPMEILLEPFGRWIEQQLDSITRA